MSEKQLLEKVLWDISNDLRGNMDATKFKDYILGLIFYRYLSYNVQKVIKDIEPDMTYAEVYNEDPEVVKEECIQAVGYFIKPNELFDEYVIKAKNGDFILDDLDTSLRELENSTLGYQSQDDFQGLFSDLNLFSQDLGIDTDSKNGKISSIISKLSEVDFQFENSEIDVLGDAYEYMISMFASDAGKKAGEFYTPQSVAKVLTNIITTEKDSIKTIYDPTCGSGSLLLRVAKDLDLNKIKHIYGEELNTTTYNLARMNMLIHNVKYDNFTIKNTNTLEKPSFMELKFDAVVANPPFSANWSADEHFMEEPRFRNFAKLAPKTKADFAFVQHMLYQVNDEGVVATVLPHGPLFRGAAEKSIREKLLNDNMIDAIIGLPQNVFFGTGIPTIILVLKKCKKHDDVLFIDASKEFSKIKTQNILEDKHIDKIINTYRNRDEIKNDNGTEFSKRVELKEIIENDYNLNIPRYVDTFVEEDPIDIEEVERNLSRLKKEIEEQEKKVEEMLKELVE